MKNLKTLNFLIIILLSISCIFISCSKKNDASQGFSSVESEPAAGSEQIIICDENTLLFTRIDEDDEAVLFNQKEKDTSDITIINCAKSQKNNFAVVSLADYADKDLYIDFSCELKLHDKKGATNQIIWMINEVNDNFPKFYDGKIKSDQWIKIQKKVFVHVGQNRQIYISGAGLNSQNLTIYLKNFRLKMSGMELYKNAPASALANFEPGKASEKDSALKIAKTGNQSSMTWLQGPSLKQTFRPYFDYVGMAVPFDLRTQNKQCMAGIKYQLDCITSENEFKPDFIFSWSKPASFTNFTAENGKTYKVPADIPSFMQMDQVLSYAKDMDIKMRGHVLVWHNQTPQWFFQKNYGQGSSELTTADEMLAREEWYIKTVFSHVKEWEAENNNGEHIILAWDIVNEAISDSPASSNILRTDSNWYKIFQNDSFITGAFRFANKYAPSDVKLVYNDYNCSIPAKTQAICQLLDSILAAKGTRIDAVGMQTHVDLNTRVTGNNSFETAVQIFIAKGLNVQITEMDIAQRKNAYNPAQLKEKYKEFFEMFLANRKTQEQKGIEGITFWGLRDEWTWLNDMPENKGYIQHPLLFQGEDFECKPAFFGVIEAAQ